MQLLRPIFLLSAMPKVAHGKGPPSSGVRRSTRRGRMPARLVDGPVASTAMDDVAELRAENQLLRQQLEQTQASDADLPVELPVSGEQWPSSSTNTMPIAASSATPIASSLPTQFIPQVLPQMSSAPQPAAAAYPPSVQDLLTSVLQQMASKPAAASAAQQTAQALPTHDLLGGVMQQMTSAQAASGGEQHIISPFLVLGSTLDPQINVKIWEGGYVDLSSMATVTDPSVSVAVTTDGQQTTISLTPVRARPPGNVMEWLRLFSTYASVYLEKHPAEAPSLLTYMVSIIYMHRNHGGFAWRLYDEKFRCIRALTPALAWHITNWDLAVEALHTVAPPPSSRQAESQPSPFHTMQSPRKSSSGVCYTYNRVGKCERTTCPYAHVCANCGRKGHARRTCRSVKTIKSHSGHTNPGLQPQA